MSFSFWRIWLIGVSIYHIVFGLLLVFFSQSALMDVLLNQYFDPVFWPDGQVTEGTLHYKGWVSSVLGSVIASWGMLIAFIAYYPFKLREKWAWNAIAAAIIFWFVVDSACSIYYNVSINAWLNLFTFSLFMLPLVLTRKYFIHREN